MAYIPRRYFITRKRLTDMPHFHKTIKMIQQVNPNQEVFLPPRVQEWFNSSWHTITAGNCIAVLENGGYIPSSIGTEPHVVKSKVVYTEALLTADNSNIIHEALKSTISTEEMLNTFIADRIAKRATAGYTSDISALLSNHDLKIYQLEELWKIQPLLDLFGNVRTLSRAPNYIVEELYNLATALETNVRYYYGSKEAELVLRECINRGLLQRRPATIFIKSELKTTPHKKTNSST